MSNTADPILIEKFKEILVSESSSEQTVQDFIERNTCLFYRPYELNHGVHLELLVSKFKLDTSLTTDFMYLTKSSGEWWCVLVELEHPGKRLFTNDAQQTATLTAAIGQVRSWKTFISRNAQEVVRRLSPLRKPLSQNRVHFKYVLVIGRTEEFEASQEKVDAFAELQQADFRVLTYDSLIHAYERKPSEIFDVITQRGQNYVMKIRNCDDTFLFMWLTCNDIELNECEKEEYKSLGYDIDSWLAGKFLSANWGKLPKDPTKGPTQHLRLD